MKLSMKRLLVLCSMVFFIIGTFSSNVFAERINEWTIKPPMLTPRYEHQVAEFNGKIYVIGGINGLQYLSSVEEYDPITDTWTTKAPMNNARAYFRLAIINGKIYAVGGSNLAGPLNSIEEYDPISDTWVTKAPMNNARAGHFITVVNNEIYVIGGNSIGNNRTKTVEKYNPVTNIWISKAQMPIAKDGQNAALINGKIYIVGWSNGNSTKSVEEYNPNTNTWVSKAAMSTARNDHSIVVLNNKIYAIGGVGLNSVEEYDPDLDQWTAKASMNSSRRLFGTSVINGKIYVSGGQASNVNLNSVEQYDPDKNTWTIMSSINNSRYGHQMTAISNSIYVIGGYDEISLNAVESYNAEFTAISPSSLIAIPGISKIDLSWTAVEGASSYNVKRATTPDGPYITITTTSAIIYADTDVTNGTTYYYVVSAVVNGTESENSNEASATPTAPGIPPDNEYSGNNAILELTMVTGEIKEYDLTISELKSFLTWYDERSGGIGKSYCIITKKTGIKPFLSRKEYISFDKISSFEVKDYNE